MFLLFHLFKKCVRQHLVEIEKLRAKSIGSSSEHTGDIHVARQQIITWNIGTRAHFEGTREVTHALEQSSFGEDRYHTLPLTVSGCQKNRQLTLRSSDTL